MSQENNQKLQEIFTPELIEYYKTNKNLITSDLLAKLREFGNDGKQLALDILDTEKSEDNYYLDAFGKKISFEGDRNLKPAFTQMKLSPIHIEEIEKCSKDLNYFMDNYIKIRTKKGYNFPELRGYQKRFIDILNSDSETVVGLLGRQCCDGDTKVNLDGQEATLKDLYDCSVPSNISFNPKFLESRKTFKKILTPLGFREIEYVHKTIPYEKYVIKTENGFILECAEKHVIIDKDDNEIYAKDCLGKEIQTVNGISKVIECTDLGFKQSMYDISIKQLEGSENTELYYSNGILSHNSGKSVTVGIFMAWHFNFNSALNIGICANKKSLAMEFLNNIKEMFYSMPMWMKQGIIGWSKTTIESELKMRVLTDAPGDNAFRGYSLSLLVIDETAWMPSEKFQALLDSVLPAQGAMSWKKNIFISTPNGMNHFYDLVEGSRKRKIIYGLNKEQVEKLKETETVLKETESSPGIFDVTIDKPSNNMALFEMDWREVPRFDSKGNRLDPEAFKEDIISKYGATYFSQNFSCVKGNTMIVLKDSLNNKDIEIPIEEAFEKIKTSVIDKKFQVLTQSGFSDFSGIRRTETNRTLKIFFGDSFIEVSEDHKFMVFGKEVIAKTLKEGDVLQTRFDKNVIITKIETSEEKCFVYDVLETKDHSYITNDVISHNCSFLGSSHTLVSKESLQRFKPQDPEMVLAQRLKVYKEPEPKHKYIIGVDPAKFGGDSYAIQVLDVTSFPFVQVASAKLKDENFQIMPGFIVEWGKWYNEGLLIIENNEGAGTYANVVIHNDYEYENLYFERTFGTFKHDTKTKIEPGFRTTPKSRNIIIDTLKQLIDNELLVINDLDTIKEFNTFVLKKDKYQADDGCHDDMIMSLCIALAPFGDVKNFDNITDLVKKMYSKDTTTDFTDYLCLGNFDDYSDFSVDDSGSFGSDFDDVLIEISKKGSY